MMIRSLKISLLIVGGLILTFATTKTTIANDIIVAPIKPLTIPQLISTYATDYNVSENQMLGTIKCESSFDPSKSGDIENGIYTSFGLVQIHLPAHPEVTKEEALNPQFAIEFMAKNFAQGNQREWTCWREIYGKQKNTPTS